MNQPSREQIKRVAARLVVDGMRRAQVLAGRAFQEQRMAAMTGGLDGKLLYLSAQANLRRAGRIRQLCGRLAAAHGIGQNGTGRGRNPRPVVVRACNGTHNEKCKRRIANAL